MFWNVIQALNMKCRMPCYMSGDKEEIKNTVSADMPAIVKAMGENNFLVGAEPVYTDFLFFEVCQLLIMVSEGKFLEHFPVLGDYCKRMKELPGVKEYIADPAC